MSQQKSSWDAKKNVASGNRTHGLPNRKEHVTARTTERSPNQCLFLQDILPGRSTTEPSLQLMIALETDGLLKSYVTTGLAWEMHLAVAALLGLSASVSIPALLALLHQNLPLPPL